MQTAYCLTKHCKIMFFKKPGNQLPPNKLVASMLRVMKLTAALLLFFALQVSATGNAQKLTMDLRDVSLQKAFKEIRKQTGYVFFYESEVLNKDSRISVRVQDLGLEETLNKCLSGLGLRYNIVDKTIIITAVPANSNRDEEKLAVTTIKVTGKVTAENTGLPLANASVNIKGSNKGATTDAGGHFSLELPDGGGVIVISYVGYETFELLVAREGNVDIALKVKENRGEEIVVVGYGAQKRANLTSAVNTVKMDELANNRPASTAGSLLQGVVPGLQVVSGTGAPGSSFDFNIRGVTSINGGGPLVLIDNVPFNGALNMINPNDIETVTVLKDAGSAAIYGARAAFGVILITSKKGTKNGKIRFDYSNNFTFSSPSSLPKKANPTQTVQAYKDMGYGAYWTGQNVDTWLQLLSDYTANPGKYPQGYTMDNNIRYQLAESDAIGQLLDANGFQQMHDFAINGGTEKTAYRMSVGIVDEDGIMITGADSYKRYNAKAFISTDVTKWLTAQMDVGYYNSTKSDPNTSTLWGGASNSPSYVPLADTMTLAGTLYPAGTPKNFLNMSVPIKDRFDDIRLYGKMIAKPLRGLTITGEFVYDNLREIYTSYNKSYEYADISEFSKKISVQPENAAYYKFNRMDERITLNLYASYNRSYRNHNFSVMGGLNQDQFHREDIWTQKTQMISADLPSISTAVGNLTSDDAFNEWSVRGFFGRFNYDYKNKYLLELNARTDGSSKFPENHRWGFFPAASVGWRVSEEDFMASLKPTLSELKLRASYGEVGNQDIAPYSFLDVMNPYLTSWPVNGVRPTTLTTPGLVSPNFTWETVRTLNLGLNMGLLKNKLNVSFDWYRRETLDMLTNSVQLPAVLGTGAPKQNTANLRSQGYELELTWTDRIGDFTYFVSGNLYDFKSQITKYDLNTAGLLSDYYVGMDPSAIWGYTTDRLYQSGDFNGSAVKPGLPQRIRNGSSYATPTAGDVLYVDVNSDGEINNGQNTLADHGDMSIIGNNRLRYQYGFRGGAGYKNWNFTFAIAGVGKRDLWLSNNMTFPYNYEFGTIYAHELDYWTPNNTDAHFAKIYAKAAGNSGVNKFVQTRYLTNAAYLRIKNIGLSYGLPKMWLDKIGFSKLQVFFSGENLFTFSKMPKGLDPTSTEDKGYGLNYPIMKMVSFGINASF